MSGTAIAQIVGFVLTPVISRLFNATDFGMFGSFNSIMFVFVAGVTLQYSQAIMLPKQDNDAANVFAVSILSVCVISLLTFVFTWIFSDWFLGILNVRHDQWILWLLPACVFVCGINQTFQAWCVRRKSFKRTASSQVIRAGSVNALQIASGVARQGSGGLIVSSVVADGLASINLAAQVFSLDRAFFKKSLAWEKVKKSFAEYREFPLYAAPQNVMNALSQGLPVLLLGHFYGIETAGAYAFGVRVISVPFNFVRTALRQVLFQRVSEIYNREQALFPHFQKMTLGLVALVLPPSLLFFVFSTSLFSWVFGQHWQTAGEFAGWLVLWLMIGFCNVPSVLIARVRRKQKQLFIYEVFQLSLRFTCLIIGGLYLNVHMTVILFTVVGIFTNFALISWVAWDLKRSTVRPEIYTLSKDYSA